MFPLADATSLAMPLLIRCDARCDAALTCEQGLRLVESNAATIFVHKPVPFEFTKVASLWQSLVQVCVLLTSSVLRVHALLWEAAF